ncbi:MAG: CDGSH iron-sulfur domain-containing protein [Alcanivorax sp.]
MADTMPNIADTSAAVVELEEGKTYWFCACGLSKAQPFCDGSHKDTGFQSIKFTAEKSGKAWLCQCKRSRKLPYCDGSHSKIAD